MTHEAGIWIFGIIAVFAISLWVGLLLCRKTWNLFTEAPPLFSYKSLSEYEGGELITPFHYQPSDYQNANGMIRGDLADQIQLAPVQPSPIPKVVSKPLPKGWQGWEGGECPVPDDTEVRVMLRDGFIYHEPNPRVLRWNHFEWPSDIVAWRVA